jgi:hypothetical protein
MPADYFDRTKPKFTQPREYLAELVIGLALLGRGSYSNFEPVIMHPEDSKLSPSGHYTDT